jgi:hypothetical protein
LQHQLKLVDNTNTDSDLSKRHNHEHKHGHGQNSFSTNKWCYSKTVVGATFFIFVAPFTVFGAKKKRFCCTILIGTDTIEKKKIE